MNDLGRKSPLQIVGAGILGFVGIVGFGSLVIMHRGGGAVKPPISVYAAADAKAGAAGAPSYVAPVGAGARLGAMGGPGSSPAPLPPADPPAAPVAAAAAAGSAPDLSAPGAAPKLVAGAHLDSAGSASSSASASSASAPAPKAPAPVKKLAVVARPDLSKNPGAVASSVHYGVSGRSELMGRAAGPVYNFSGGAAGAQGGRVAADNAAPNTADALRQVDDARRRIDESDAPAADKAKIDGDLKQVRETAAAATGPGTTP